MASDVAARGLDIPDVGHVFCYGPPPNSDDYVHRIGRTGRAGRKGESFTIVSPRDQKLWDSVIKRIGQDVENFWNDDIAAEVENASSRPERRPRKNDDLKQKRGRGRTRDESRSREETQRDEPHKEEPRQEEQAGSEEQTPQKSR